MKLTVLKISFLLVIVSITGCRNNTTQTKASEYDMVKSVKKVIVNKTASVSCDTTVINQEFSFNTLAFDIFKADTNKIKSLFLDPVVLKMEKQTNAGQKPYYLYHFTDGINQIDLYRNEDFYIEQADIKNDRMCLNKKISIGMSKGDFGKLLKMSNVKCDTITVKDDELTFESVYIFKNDKLGQIKMGQILE